mgnify:FL=1|jgi:outer membrane protein OmpA-like peptidoglycan-associated protein
MQTNQIRFKQAVFSLILLFGSNSLLSANELNHSSTGNLQLSGAGIGAGLAIFALGPVGIIPGAIFGVLTTDNIDKNHQLSILKEQQQHHSQQLSQVSDERDTAEKALLELQQKHNSALTELKQSDSTLVSLQQPSFTLSSQILFRTAESQIEAHYHTELSSIANLLNIMPHLQVMIEAHADEKGSAEDNYDLSVARANAVYYFFENAGIDASRLSLKALGEAEPVFSESSLENDAYHRRVSIQVNSATEMLTNPSL